MLNGGFGSVTFYVTQEHAKPFRAIGRAVMDMSPQFLVVECRGMRHSNACSPGSIANEVLRNIECDALIVSPSAVQHVRSTIDGRMLQGDLVKRTAEAVLNETGTR